MDYSILEQQKENIQPVAAGRPATALVKHFDDKAADRKADFEKQIRNSSDLDDPLQVYLDYLMWTQAKYPQGANTESGLLHLLERCTSKFRDDPIYKNDPRYLKTWLQYASFSDHPRDIFTYLAKKEIGCRLALYYEEFAKFLECRGNNQDAHDVYVIGIEREARPLDRLQRNFRYFQERTKHLAQRPVSRLALATVAGPPIETAVEEPQPKRQKLHIHTDPERFTIRDSVFRESDKPVLQPLRLKENVIPAKPWAGEMIRQKSQTETKPAKFSVFRDTPSKDYNVVEENGVYTTQVEQPGKPTEKLMLNMDLVRPSDGEEYSFTEILILKRKLAAHRAKSQPELPQKSEPRPPKWASRLPQSNWLQPKTPTRSQKDTTITIPLKDDSMTRRQASPTMTQFSKATAQDVVGMFNSAAHQLFDDTTRYEEPTTTNFDGFVTETIHAEAPAVNVEQPETPPMDHYDSGSSPFVE